MTNLPPAFLAQMSLSIGEELPDFLKALSENTPVSVRLNARKKHPDHSEFDKIPWHTEGYFLPVRPSFTLDPTFHAGAYYVQEASSMFIAEAATQLIDFQRDMTVLDLCAAPGGKSTLLASLLSEDSFLLANEVIKSRVDILKENIQKWGYPNVHVTNHDSEDFLPLEGFFDLVLVDAPCSGEGLFRKDPKAANEWSPDSVQACSKRQKRILANAAKLLKPDGILLYSTCTYNDFENKNNVEWLLKSNDFEQKRLKLNPDWGICEKELGYQFYPHKVRGEGFFLSVLQKKNGAIDPLSMGKLRAEKLPKKQVEAASKWLKSPDKFEFYVKANGQVFIILKNHVIRYALIDKVLQRKSSGVSIGEFKGNDFIPSHELALSIEISDGIPSVNLSKNEALRFLKKENIELQCDAPQGWVLAQYEGLNLGWMKVLKNRINNYLPKDFRIRMKLNDE